MKVCTACDLYIVEDLRHVIMQCLSTEYLHTQMFCELNKISEGVKTLMRDNCAESFEWIMGKEMTNVDRDTMYTVWAVAGEFISKCTTKYV